MAATIRPSDSIYELDLPMRTYNALSRNNVRTVGDLCEISEPDFLRMRGVGLTSLEKTKAKLARHGFAMRSAPLAPPDPGQVAEAAWIGRQLEALAQDSRVYAHNKLGARWEGEGYELKNRRRAWAWFKSIAADEEWPEDVPGGFGYMATPLPGSLELHLDSLNRLAHEELDGE